MGGEFLANFIWGWISLSLPVSLLRNAWTGRRGEEKTYHTIVLTVGGAASAPEWVALALASTLWSEAWKQWCTGELRTWCSFVRRKEMGKRAGHDGWGGGRSRDSAAGCWPCCVCWALFLRRNIFNHFQAIEAKQKISLIYPFFRRGQSPGTGLHGTSCLFHVYFWVGFNPSHLTNITSRKAFMLLLLIIKYERIILGVKTE